MLIVLLPLALALPASAVSSGPPVQAERRVMLSGFDRIRVDGGIAVIVTTGGGAGARVSGEGRSDEPITLRVEGSTLIVKPALPDGRDRVGRRESSGGVTVRVTTPMLKSASVIGGGSLTVDRLSGPRVDASLTGSGTLRVGDIDAEQVNATLIGSGELTATGRAVRARFLANGPGSILAEGLTADDLFVRLEGSGTTRHRARYAADITVSGSGSVDVAGSPRCRTRGTGNIRCGMVAR